MGQPRKKYTISFSFSLRQVTVFVLIFLAIGGAAVLYKSLPSKGASYGWLQTTWSGGISTTATSTHTTEQANPGGWSQFFSKDSNLSTSTNGQLSLTATTASSTDTATADFSAGTASNTYVSNGSVFLKKPNGVACTTGTECTIGYCVNSVCNNLAVGDTYQGGKVFYLSGGHGLISMTSDTSASAQWGCYGSTISGADSTTDGAQNTIDIVNGCAEASRAARLCSDLSSGGYTDWYLPAKDQLYTLYGQQAIVGGFTTSTYWSSTEGNSSNAWDEIFSNGNQYWGNKDGNAYVRCIRSF